VKEGCREKTQKKGPGKKKGGWDGFRSIKSSMGPCGREVIPASSWGRQEQNVFRRWKNPRTKRRKSMKKLGVQSFGGGGEKVLKHSLCRESAKNFITRGKNRDRSRKRGERKRMEGSGGPLGGRKHLLKSQTQMLGGEGAVFDVN